MSDRRKPLDVPYLVAFFIVANSGAGCRWLYFIPSGGSLMPFLSWAAKHLRLLPSLPGVLLLQSIIFLVDVSVPLGPSIWMLYLFPLWLSAADPQRARSRVLITKASCTGLIVLGYLWSPPGAPPWMDASNRALGIMIGWCVAVILLRAAHQRCEQRRIEQALRESEEHFRAIYEQAAIGIIRIGLDARVLDINCALCRILGYPRTELVNRPYHELLHPEDLDREQTLIDRLVRGEIDRYALETRYVHKDGHAVWSRVTSSLVKRADGVPQGRIAVVEDVSERKRAEEALREADERQRKLLCAGLTLAESLEYDKTLNVIADLMVPEHADWCFIDLLQEGTPVCERVAVRCSDPARRGYAEEFQRNYAPDLTRPHPIRRTVETGHTEYNFTVGEDWIEPYARDARHAFLLQQIEVAAVIIVPLKVQRRVAGTFSLVASRWSGRRFSQKDVEFAEEIGRRASLALEHAMLHRHVQRLLVEAEQRERELREKQQQLIQAAKLASIGQLASGVAHELNNPLNNIGLFAGNLLDAFKETRRHRDRKSVIETLQMIERQVRKATDIITQLRTFSRSAGSVKRPINLHDVIFASLKLMQEPLRLSDIAVCLRLTSEHPTILGNEIQLEQVFLNLITNARDAMKEAATRRLVITTEVQENDVTIRVEDTGAGIVPADLPRIFDPFFTTKDVGHGTGLGLSISYGIIQDHQGEISVQSTPGQGSVFLIRLPLAETVAGVTTGPSPHTLGSAGLKKTAG